MIIGVDAGALSISDERLKVGVWRVTFELLKKLSSIDTRNFYRLYSFAPIPKNILNKLGTNMMNIILTPSVGYMKFRLPLELMLRPVDLFLGLSQALPYMRHGKKIGFIYDIGFLLYPEKYGLSAGRLKNQTEDIADRSDDIITISQSVKTDIHTLYGVPNEKIHVCYPGVSSVFTRTGKKETKRYPYFLFVGSLWKGKNIPVLLSAFHRFINRTPLPHHLVLVGGDYWQDPEIGLTLKRLNLNTRIHFLGHVADERLAGYYRGATAFVMATLTEGFCLPVVEAMASGCPVIASHIRTISEVLGHAGILVNPTDTKGLCDSMTLIATDNKKRVRYQLLGFKRVKNYSWDVFAEKVYNIIFH
jgi:glycosyltransferase involved in cell wall biosynthesis